MKKYSCFFLLFALLFAACLGKKPLTKRLFYEKIVIDFGMQNPELISFVEPPLLDRFWHYKAKLTPVSPEFEAKMADKIAEKTKILESYNSKNSSPQKQLSYDIMHWFLQNETEGNAFLYYNYPVNQLHGIQSETPSLMISTHSVKNLRDVKSYLSRLKAFDKKFAETIEGMEKRRGMGIIPPTFVLKKVISQMKDFISTPAKENALYISLKEKMEKAHFSPKKQAKWLQITAISIEKEVYPAYQKLIDYCEKLLPQSTTEDGVWKFPNGKAYYAHALKTHTTTNLSADEIHEIGLVEVARLEKEAQKILDSLGIRGKTVGESLANLAKKSNFLYPNTAEGRNQCLKDYQTLIDSVYIKIPLFFDVQPKSKVKVLRVPVFKEKTAPGAYYEPPSLGGKRPGIFYANLRSLAEIPTWSMATLAFHEAVPGHHFQIGIQQELKQVPTFRKVLPFTAYMEGWALYAEYLAVEMGAHKDAYSLLGYYQAQLFRAVRLVVDTGIHEKKWTREQAITYMLAHTGMPENDVVAEIERYIVDPGQACAYKIGQLKILELRKKAQVALGNRFSMKEFHHLLLTNGAMPLEVMEKVVESYIQAKKG